MSRPRAIAIAASAAGLALLGACGTAQKAEGPRVADPSGQQIRHDRASARASAKLDGLLVAARTETKKAQAALPDDADRESLVAYARIRSLLHAQAYERAAEMATELVERTGGDADALRLLGDALLASGDRQAAVAQWNLAAERGLTAPGPLAMLASELADDGDWEAVRSLTLRAASATIGDPGLEAIVFALLGKSLLRTGEPVAGAEAIRRGVDFDSPFNVRTEYADEVNLVATDAPALWAEAGHAALDAGEPGLALALFERIPEGAGWADPFGGRYRAKVALGDNDGAAELLSRLSASQAAVLDERVLALADHARAQAIVFKIAELEEGSPLRRSGTARVWRSRLQARLLGPEQGRELLWKAWAERPGHEGLLLDLLGWPDEHAMHEHAARAITLSPPHSPEIAGSYVSLGGRIEEGFTDPALLAEVAIQSGDRRLIERSLSAQIDPATVAEKTRRARLLGALGRTDEARLLIASITEPESLADAVLIASALDELQLSVRAARVLDRAMQRTDRSDPHWRTAARRFVAIAGNIGDAALAERVLLRRLDEDPLEEWAVSTLGALYAQVGGEDARQRLDGIRTRAVRSIPGSRSARRVMLAARAEAGRAGPFESSLAWSLARERPWDAALTTLAVQIDLLMGADPEPALRSLAEDFPDTEQPLNTLARYLAERRGDEGAREAEELLQARVERPLHAPGSLRLLEQLAAGPLDDKDRASSLRDSRLEREAFGIDTLLELAALHAERGEHAEAARLIARAMGSGVTVRSGQRQTLEGVVASVSRAAASDLGGPVAEPAHRMLARLHEAGMALGPEFLELRAGLAATRAEPDIASINETRRIAEMVDEETADRLRTVPAQALRGVGRFDEALESVVDALQGERDIRPGELALWAFLISRVGDGDDLRAMLASVEGAEDAQQIIAQIAGGEREPESLDGWLAELAYAIASAATTAGRRDAADAMYREALQREPTHIWASNDLGYHLAEQGRKLDESLRLISQAHDAKPDNASIVDSMGWILYRLGYFEDLEGEAEPGDPRPDGEGAITLLKRAVELSGDEPGVTPPMQLGDALWRARRERDAVDAWELALAEAARILREHRDEPGRLPQWYVEEVEQRTAGLRDRLGAVERGEDPPVAEVFAREGSLR
ncbi:MAG: hypothetical protein EA423_04585 [Phycisphaerales bacterium]|nr:MAG: hypothetical protein EA423_04585 [Phycisphaerales bacterium]